MEKGRDVFARLVSDKQKEILSRRSDMPPLDAFRLATSEVLKERPEILAAYRSDQVLTLSQSSGRVRMTAEHLEWK